MATTVTKQRNVRYLNSDFESLKRDLIEHIRVHFPNDYNDFNESSVGVMLVELMAYIGDNLSFYLDKKFAETFIDTARERKNILKHAKQLGFKTSVFGKAAATGKIDTFIQVPAITENEKIQADMRYAGKVKKGTKLLGSNGKIYEVLEDVDFSGIDPNDTNLVVVAETDGTTNQPISFALKKEGADIKAGETKTTTFTVAGYQSFLKLTLPDDDVLEVLNVRDSTGNIWYEVDYLAQDTVFDSVSNTSSDSNSVPFVLKLRSVPFRFITEFNVDTNRVSLIFGTGDAQKFDGELIPDIGDLSLPLLGKDTFSDFTIDPQNFLKTRTLGIAPVNTVLTVRYRVGGGSDTNAGTNQISSVAEVFFEVADTSLSQTTVNDVKNSFSVLNSNPVQGGRDETSLDEIKYLISANFASQSRAVTAEDYIVRSLSLPSKFGSIFRAHAKSGVLNRSSVELIILTKDSLGNPTTASSTLKENLKKYLSRFRLLTDSVEILDGEVINIGIDFGILTKPDFNKSEVLGNCILALKDFFDVNKWQIGQPLVLSQIQKLLFDVPGVLTVFELKVSNISGTFEGRTYSSTTYNIDQNTKNAIVYCKDNAMFAVKYPLKDLRGSSR